MRKLSEVFCWFCNETVKDCEHQKNREQKKMNKFLNWINYGGNEKNKLRVINNHYTPYGQGYNQAMTDIYSQCIKTFKIKGLHE